MRYRFGEALQQSSKKGRRVVITIKHLPKMIVKTVRSQYEKGATTKVRVSSDLSDELSVNMVVHQDYIYTPPLFAIVMDVMTKDVRNGVLHEILYADDLVLMSESTEDL